VSAQKANSTCSRNFKAMSRSSLPNLTYNGIFIQKGSALAELGPAGLRLMNLELSDKTGTVKGTVILSPDGQFEYSLEWIAKRSVTTLSRPPGPHNSMDGRPHGFARTGMGEQRYMNGDISFKARAAISNGTIFYPHILGFKSL